MDDPSLSLPPPITSQPLVPYQLDITETVLELRHLTTVLSAFHRRYDDLQSHLNFISTSIDALTPISDQTLVLEQSTVSPSEKSPTLTPEETLLSKNHISPDQTRIPPPGETLILEKSLISHLGETLILNNPQIPPTKKALVSEKALIEEENLISEKNPISLPENISSPEKPEIVSLCKSMKGNSLRKYLFSRLSEPEKLLEEVPAALKQCPNPSKLVLDCIGQFYLLGTKIDKKTRSLNPSRTVMMNPSRMATMNRSRMVTIIVLECLLIADCEVIKSEIKDLAEIAMTWRERMVNEGGIGKASEIDAKGLLLFIGCFGIPDDFKDDDVLDLVRVSNGKVFLDLLCRSKILIMKMTEIIKAKEKENKYVEALDIAFTFGPEVIYSPKCILGNFLRNSKKSWNVARELVHDSELDQAIILFKNQLADLNSLVKCLEEHKVDPSDLLPNWHPNKRMGQIERELAELDKKLEKREQKLHTKRKADQSEPSKKPTEKKVKKAHLSQGLEQQKVVSFMNNSPPGAVLLPRGDPGVVLSRPYQIEDAFDNERFVGRGLGGPERFVSPNHIGPERYLGPSYIGPERFVGPSGIERERFVSPSGIEPGKFMGRSYADLYKRYLRPPPSGISGSSGLSSKSDLYGFADAVIERESANGDSVRSAPFTHRPRHHRY